MESEEWDSSPSSPHSSFSTKKQLGIIPAPTLFAGFNNTDFRLLPNMKMQLKGCRCSNCCGDQERITEGARLTNGKRLGKRFQKCHKRWDRCVAPQSDYLDVKA